VPVVRPIDRWFIDEILPWERDLLAAAGRLCNGSDEAQDLVQDVFARMLTIEAWSAIADPRAYMKRMMRNLVIERIRRAKIVDFRQLVDADHLDLPDDAPDQHRIAEDRQAMADLVSALDTLPERCRTPFVRRRIDGHAPGDIARDLDISVSTLEKRLARAIQLLTRAFQPHRHGDATINLPETDTALRK
jgi:RNA polymerase sigma-70 factor (ECF subfamily)